MHRSELTWSVIVVSLMACSADPHRVSAGFGDPGTGGDSTGSGGEGNAGTTDDDDAAPDDSTTGSGGFGSTDGGPEAGPPFVPDGPVMVRHGDASVGMCSRDRATVGGTGLEAAGATPSAFAEAFNAEQMELTTGGPFLLLLSGVNPGSGAPKMASFGALEKMMDGVGFAETPAVVPFSIDGAGTVQIPKKDAAFALAFVAPASAARIPVASVEMTAALASTCTSLSISNLRMLVPATAGAIAFHGSTVGALMGTPTAGVQGGSNNAWPIELSGKVKQVFAAIVDDAGGGPL